MFDMFGKINEIKQKMQAVQEELKQMELRTEREGVTVIINGEKEIKKIEIADALLQSGDKTALEENIRTVVNQAVKDAETVAKNKMMEVTQGMLPPDLPAQ
jgi:DNA-binding YbaB/EbfC family protein